MKNSSTHELISGLPDLNDSEKPNVIDNNMSNENDTLSKVSFACHTVTKIISINLRCFLKAITCMNHIFLFQDTTHVEDATQNNDEENIIEDVDKVQTEKDTEIDENPVTEQIHPTETENIEEADNAETVSHEHTNGNFEKEDQIEPEQTVDDTLDKNEEETELKQSNINAENQDILDDKNSHEEDNVTENVNESNNEPKEIINDEDKNNQNADENVDLKNEEANEDGEDNDKKESIVNDAPDSLEIVSQLDSEQEGKQESFDDKTYADDDDKQDHGNEKSRCDVKGSDQHVDEHRTTSHEGNDNDNGEDDDDVQVQGSPHEHDIHTSDTFKQRNGSATRGDTSPGHTHI